MRWLIAAFLLVPALAHAQPGAQPPGPVQAAPASTSPEILGLARGAHVAGVRGDCVGARTLAARIQRQDPDFYAAVVSTDPSITACKPKPRVYAVAPQPHFVVDPEMPSVLHRPIGTPAETYARTAPIDRGRNIAGQMFLGTVMGAGLGLLGGVVGAGLIRDEEVPIGALLFGSIGIVAGSTAGVVLAGDNAGSDYSLGLTITGSITGAAIGWKIAAANSIDSPAVAIAIIVGAPTLGAMLGFNAARRTLTPTGSTQVAVPSATRISDPTTSVPVIGGSF